MKVTCEINNLYYFDAWGQAKETKQKILEAGLGEDFMTNLSEYYPDGLQEDDLNDLLWFEDEFCLHLVGLKTEEEEEADEHNPQKIADDNGWFIFQIPSWALCYLMYGEADDLTEEDIEQIEHWQEKYHLVDVVDDWETGEMQEEYFCISPAFGKGCNVVDCYCEEKKDESEK